MVAVSLPPVLVAVMVYVVVELTMVGRPHTVPLEVSNVSPDGKDGDIDQDVMTPPFTVGVTEVMAVPLVRVKLSGS